MLKVNDGAGTSRGENVLLSQEEYEKHLEEIKMELKKKETNWTHIRLLLKETYDERRRWLKEIRENPLTTLIDNFPCFKEGILVSLLKLNIISYE